MSSDIIRIAMWSGPRNLSTAMMRSFGSRQDTRCIDEPFYAAYLAMTGLDHPCVDDILRVHDSDPARVSVALSSGPSATPIVYQKHMTHHMIPDMPLDWMAATRHAFLIRHPARVIASYRRKMDNVSLDALGYPRQLALYHHARALTGQDPVVLDSDDVLARPDRVLRDLCAGLSIPFDRAMLAWSPGPKPEDGIWARHWYDRVNLSTGFADTVPALPAVSDADRDIFDAAINIYTKLAEKRIGQS